MREMKFTDVAMAKANVTLHRPLILTTARLLTQGRAVTLSETSFCT